MILFTGGPPQCMLGYHPPPPQADTPQEQIPPRSRHPPEQIPQEQTPPQADIPQTRHPPDQTPPGSRHPLTRLPRSRHPPPEQTPSREADSGIRSTSGRYASYLNAFLFRWRIQDFAEGMHNLLFRKLNRGGVIIPCTPLHPPILFNIYIQIHAIQISLFGNIRT